MARSAGKSASDLLRCEGFEIDDLTAMDFDRACNYRLIRFDNDCRKQQAVLIANEVAKLFGDGTSSSTVNINHLPEAP